MEYKESSTCELKRELTADLKKEVVAFANSDGGTIYIGIRDDGSIEGIPNADAVCMQSIHMIRDTIRPDVTMFTNCKVQIIEDNQVIVITIQRGTNRPYYIADKGLKPSGVYVRQGASSVPASEGAIKLMIKETDGDKYEEVRSINQELSFQYINDSFLQQKLAFTNSQMITLGIINSYNEFTNLGLLLSDQCPYTIKAAIFASDNKNEFKDRREFSGSLLKQLNGVYDYIDLNNKNQADFIGLTRIDNRDYPPTAIREALLNSIVHRDYSFSGSTLINIYNNRIDFVSLGGLVQGLSVADILLGISQTRNEKLAAIFYRLRLIEAYGTGIVKIMDNYNSYEEKPSLKVSDHAFVLSLPNMNTSISSFLESPEQIILNYLQTHLTINRKTVEQLLGIGQTAAGRILKELTAKNMLQTKGVGKNLQYILP